MTADYTRFKGMRGPRTDFESVQNDLQTLPFYYDVDLTNARSIASGTALQLPITGNVLYIDQVTSTGSARIAFQDNSFAGVTPITCFPGFIAKIPFTQLQIENDAQPGLRIRIIYGTDLDFTPAIGAGVFGTISVIDNSKARTQAGQAFMAGYYVSGGGVGNFTEIQLINPSGSGKNAFLKGFSVASSVTGIVVMSTCNTPLTNLAATTPKNKLIGGAAAACQLRYVATNPFLSGSGDSLVTVSVIANQSAYWPLQEPIELTPGKGVEVYATAGNNLGVVTFEFIEESA